MQFFILKKLFNLNNSRAEKNLKIIFLQFLGEAFFSFHSTVATCLTTSMILSIVYFFSANSYDLIKQSIFEILFNTFACFIYASSSVYMGFASNLSLYPRFFSSQSEAAFPALVSVYVSVNDLLNVLLLITCLLSIFSTSVPYLQYAMEWMHTRIIKYTNLINEKIFY